MTAAASTIFREHIHTRMRQLMTAAVTHAVPVVSHSMWLDQSLTDLLPGYYVCGWIKL